MPRALTAEWQRVTPADQQEAAQQWRWRRDVLAREGCRHWLFRNPADPDAYLEFIEAGSAAILEEARSRAGMKPAAEVLIELELS